MKFAASGQWPDKGFREESFPAKSFRAGLCGMQLARGWKRLGILFVNLLVGIPFVSPTRTQTTKNNIGILFRFRLQILQSSSGAATLLSKLI